MFTGIVEELGVIKNRTETAESLELIVHCGQVLQGSQVGDSIMVNGTCLTVTRLFEDSFSADVSAETLRLTNLGELATGHHVNLERSITMSTRLGGHLVQGHVDGTATVASVVNEGDSQMWFFDCPADLLKFMILKGSVTVNGVSLTIAQLNEAGFAVALIPKTLELTTFKFLGVGDMVNIETDMVGRYVHKYIADLNLTSAQL